jgi:hypothetical protein
VKKARGLSRLRAFYFYTLRFVAVLRLVAFMCYNSKQNDLLTNVRLNEISFFCSGLSPKKPLGFVPQLNLRRTTSYEEIRGKGEPNKTVTWDFHSSP